MSPEPPDRPQGPRGRQEREGTGPSLAGLPTHLPSLGSAQHSRSTSRCVSLGVWDSAPHLLFLPGLAPSISLQAGQSLVKGQLDEPSSAPAPEGPRRPGLPRATWGSASVGRSQGLASVLGPIMVPWLDSCLPGAHPGVTG